MAYLDLILLLSLSAAMMNEGNQPHTEVRGSTMAVLFVAFLVALFRVLEALAVA